MRELYGRVGRHAAGYISMGHPTGLNPTMTEPDRLRSAYRAARDALLRERTPDGFWAGELSASALSTATAVAALSLAGRSVNHSGDTESLINNGLRWLCDHQNADGGWGDTVKSVSNISTTMLCRAAFHIAGKAERHARVLAAVTCWLEEHYAERADGLAAAIRRRYGADRTFSVPILMTCALAGLVPWREVPRLPFELACLPRSMYRLARMQVVSYALPALIAIGQVVHHFRPTRNPLKRLMRWLARERSLRVLEQIQPASGGYLEATPLTSFVVMSLAAMRAERNRPSSLSPSPPASGGEGLGVRGVKAGGDWTLVLDPAGANPAHPGPLPPKRGEREEDGNPADRVIARGVEFLVRSVRPDGSWPIDTNLSIWVTTLSVNALAAADDLEFLDRRDELFAWLLDQQTTEVHPYTGAAAGAWGWSHLPGSVPDCDDTPGATIALIALERHFKSGEKGCDWNWGMARNWMKDLQNRDGGWPTFCRGWGRLPFDRSGADLTAHCLRAFWALGDDRKDYFQHLYGQAVRRGLRYLGAQQRPDGSWLPLWFGNQHAPDDINPVYGTARVLAAYRDLNRAHADETRRGIAFLLAVQNTDGGWGGAKDTPSSVEETALAVEVLLDLVPPESRAAVDRGLAYLVCRVEDGSFTDPAPIGFYFAKLWYFEKLYPIIFTVAALGRAVRRLTAEPP
ncbi:MAG TPA: prenyltransferase/squalene oxidase repeat-containing protein [Gemmataceae bacterium]|nr:prenyltransferase/squalene oxidase repeat-containing protein [Gemmataceae bacterium]